MNPHAPRRSTLNAVDWLIAATMIVAPLCMGGRHPVGRLVFVALIGLVAVTWFWQQFAFQRRSWRLTGVEWLAVAALGILVLQLLPWPQAWLLRISPALGQRLPLLFGATHEALRLEPWSQISLDPVATRRGLTMCAAYSLWFLVLAQRLRTIDDVERILRWVASAAILMAIVGLAQYAVGNGKFLWVYSHPSRDTFGVMRGAFINQNHFAHMMALGIGPLLWWLIRKVRQDTARDHSGWGRRPAASSSSGWLVTALGVVVIAGLLTFSRAGLAAMAVAATLCVGVFAAAGWIDRRVKVAMAVLGVFLAVALATNGYQPVANRLATVVGARSLEDMSAGRQQIWSAAGKATGDFARTGVGVGAHAAVYPMYLEQYSDVLYTHAESGYLQIVEEAGLPGLALLIIALMTVANWCRLALRPIDSRQGEAPAELGLVAVSARRDRPSPGTETTSRRVRMAAVAAIAGLGVSVLHAIVDFVWYIPACMTLTLALAACVWRLSKEADEASAIQKIVMPRFAWNGLACIVTLLAFVMIVTHWGPALAARHWDQYTRLSLQSDELELVKLSVGQIDDAQEVTRRAEAQQAAMARELEAVVRHDVSNALAHCRLSELCLQQFELAQRTAANNMSLAQIREAALESNFATLKAQDQWLEVAIPENKKLLDQALFHARRAIRLSPLRGEAYVHLAQLGFLEGDGTRAKQAYLAQALRVRPHDGEVLMAVGFELALAGKSSAAAEYFLRVFRQAPHYRDQIITVFAPRMPADAFLQLFKPDLTATERLFAYYRKSGLTTHAETAGRYYVAHIERQPEQVAQSMTAEQWYQVFVVHDFLGNTRPALESLERAVALAPKDFPIRRKLGRQLLKHQQFARAQQHLRWCVEQMPNDESLQRDLRTCLNANAGTLRR